jgi:hypothetical protein
MPGCLPGYEHNFGHGRRNLSVVFAMLIMAAFLGDEAQQLRIPFPADTSRNVSCGHLTTLSPHDQTEVHVIEKNAPPAEELAL